MRATLVLAGLVSPVVGAGAQVHIATESARCTLAFDLAPGRTLSVARVFRLETALAALFHAEVSAAADAQSQPAATSVHVRATRTDDGADGRGARATVEAVASTTAAREGAAPPARLAAALNEAAASRDLRGVLAAGGLVAPGGAASLACAAFDGASDERGVAFTQMDQAGSPQNGGWPMFVAGVALTLLCCGSVGVGLWVYRREGGGWPCAKGAADRGAEDSVHYGGDVDLEDEEMTTATAATGILGANNDGNRGALQHLQRRKSGRASHLTEDTAWGSPETVVSSASRHPVGITPAGTLESFRTPQRPKSARVQMYDMERLTRT